MRCLTLLVAQVAVLVVRATEFNMINAYIQSHRTCQLLWSISQAQNISDSDFWDMKLEAFCLSFYESFTVHFVSGKRMNLY